MRTLITYTTEIFLELLNSTPDGKSSVHKIQQQHASLKYMHTYAVTLYKMSNQLSTVEHRTKAGFNRKELEKQPTSSIQNCICCQDL